MSFSLDNNKKKCCFEVHVDACNKKNLVKYSFAREVNVKDGERAEIEKKYLLANDKKINRLVFVRFTNPVEQLFLKLYYGLHGRNACRVIKNLIL